MTLISIAIIFPLVFTIRGSFRRREKALEHLSEFRSSLIALNYMVMGNVELQQDDKEVFNKILSNISTDFISHLGDINGTTGNLDDSLKHVYRFLAERELISRNLRDKIIRYMSKVHESIENLHAIHTHRTPISLKAYCKVFIFIFPLIYAPAVINNVGIETSKLVTYSIVFLTEFILISLYNIQNHLEYPFDNKGLDDIKLASFRMDR